MNELLQHRELFYFLVWRDIKVRYKQTFLGIAWAVIQPLAAVLIFSLFFGRVASMAGQTNVAYPIFVYSGLLAWMYFANSVTNGANSLVTNVSLVTKVYFPRAIIPSVPLISGLVDFMISFAILLLLMVYYSASIGWEILLLPFLLLGVTILGLGLNLFLSSLNAQLRDVRHAIPFVMQIWLFASPVIYPPHFVPDKYRFLLNLNPMTGYLEGFHSAILGQPWHLESLAIAIVLSLFILAAGWLYFHRVEATLADVI
jgi:lipopolysaccharide transport system permease protein